MLQQHSYEKPFHIPSSISLSPNIFDLLSSSRGSYYHLMMRFDDDESRFPAFSVVNAFIIQISYTVRIVNF